MCDFLHSYFLDTYSSLTSLIFLGKHLCPLLGPFAFDEVNSILILGTDILFRSGQLSISLDTVAG